MSQSSRREDRKFSYEKSAFICIFFFGCYGVYRGILDCCCCLEYVFRIDCFCPGRLSRILAHYLFCCECPTNLPLYSALVSPINAIIFSLFLLCFGCTLLEHISHSSIAPICILQYRISLLHHHNNTPTHSSQKPILIPQTMSSIDEISTNDKQFIIECLKNLDEDRLVPFSPPPPSSYFQAYNQILTKITATDQPQQGCGSLGLQQRLLRWQPSSQPTQPLWLCQL